MEKNKSYTGNNSENNEYIERVWRIRESTKRQTFDVERQWRRGEQDQQRLATEDEEE